MSHGDMPEFIFEPDEIADLMANDFRSGIGSSPSQMHQTIVAMADPL